MKTSLLIDLALSLGSGTPFLGEFIVPQKRRTVVISGESGPHTIQDTARRVALAKGIDLADVDTFWDFRLPQLASAFDLAELSHGLRDRGAEVAIIEPLYLSLLAGQQGLQATNLYDMGPLLLRVADACRNAGATPILGHHAKRGRTTGPNEPLDLDDLAFAGVAEFARQWLLLSRREAYKPDSGLHHLWLTAGGSMGHGGLWAVDVDEGLLNDDFSGRHWRVAVQKEADCIKSKLETKGANKSEANAKANKSDDAKLISHLVLQRYIS